MLKKMLIKTVTPEKAPNKTEYVEIEFEKGIPVSLNGKKMEGVALINALNKIGGANGIGITDLVENRVTGMKTRGVYEAPGGSILYYAHRELEHHCLDRQTYSFKQQISLKLAELIYGGLWYTPLREALCAFVDSTQQAVNGKVKLKLYKGSIGTAGVSSPNSLYNASLATGELHSHADSKGFVKIYGIPALLHSLLEFEKKGGKLPASAASAKTTPKSKAAAAQSSSGRGRTAKKK
jgi:argininosuccinate synthase